MTDWKKTFLAFVQKIHQPLNKIIADGCHMDRKLWTYFENTPFTDVNLQHFNPMKSPKTFLTLMVNSIIYGNATK